MLGIIRIAINRWHDNDAPVLSDHLRYHKVCSLLMWIFDDLMIWHMMKLGYGDDAVPVSLFYEVYAIYIYIPVSLFKTKYLCCYNDMTMIWTWYEDYMRIIWGWYGDQSCPVSLFETRYLCCYNDMTILWRFYEDDMVINHTQRA